MIRSLGVLKTLTYSQTLNRREASGFMTEHQRSNRIKLLVGHVSGKQDWRCGMNRKSS